jgi:lactococcin 972 family bacteriocin
MPDFVRTEPTDSSEAGDMSELETSRPKRVTRVTLTFDHELTDAEVEQLKSKNDAVEARDLKLTRKYPAGGIWDYGSDQGINCSYYYHPDKKHRASVSNNKYGVQRSPCADPGTWASAVEASDPGTNKAFWDIDSCN